MYKISLKKLNDLFELVSKNESVYIPVDVGGQAKFEKWSDDKIISKQLNTVRSAKDFFFPQTENMMSFKLQDKNIEITEAPLEDENFVIFGVRACDARSFELLDMVFLAEPVDTYYKNRREHATIITSACNQPEETCFCSAFGIDAANPCGDVSTWSDDSDIYFSANTQKGAEFISGVSSLLEEAADNAADSIKTKINDIMDRLPLKDFDLSGFSGDVLLEKFNSQKWAELSQSCIGCGTCTFVCPTCQCYDIRDYDTGNGICRYRCWDSCMYSDFTKMAHGNPRTSQLERFRQRFMHKLVYFPANNDGVYSCVGCGRCLQKCPISMNIVKVVKSFNDSKDK